jgi:Ran GTPase-activating protein (RanGAP) involved in mRNA processing and transport
LFNLLTTNKTLKILDYSLNQLGEEGDMNCAKAIANCFRTNKSLEHVDLSFNNIGKEATQIIA